MRTLGLRHTPLVCTALREGASSHVTMSSCCPQSSVRTLHPHGLMRSQACANSVSQELTYLIFAAALWNWHIASTALWMGKVVPVPYQIAETWRSKVGLIYLHCVTCQRLWLICLGKSLMSVFCEVPWAILKCSWGWEPPSLVAKLIFLTKTLKMKKPRTSLFMESMASQT